MLVQASKVARICARGASTLTRQCPVSRARPCLSRRLQPVRAMASEVEAAQKAAAAQQCAQDFLLLMSAVRCKPVSGATPCICLHSYVPEDPGMLMVDHPRSLTRLSTSKYLQTSYSRMTPPSPSGAGAHSFTAKVLFVIEMSPPTPCT